MKNPSKSSPEYDLIIIGGGCSGLSLAASLCKLASKPEDLPLTLIIEPRSEYTNDRSWCFWDSTDQADGTLISKSWSTWEFSTNSCTRRHTSESGWKYHYISAIKFYNHVEKQISYNPKVTLLKNSCVTEVCPVEDYIEIYLQEGKHHNDAKTEKILTKQVVDTRFPQKSSASISILKQVFFGFEVRTDKPHDFEDVAMVMKDMRVDKQGFLFDYVLPISRHNLLLEFTRFSANYAPPESLRSEALELLHRVLGNTTYKVVREEFGIIPMGLKNKVSSADPRWVRTGLAAGAARPSTGFAFKRIQHWAHLCAEAILDGRLGFDFQSDNKILKWMDKIFLNTIKENPAIAPLLFMSLAHNVPPEKLARFLTDQPKYGDYFSMMRALPKLPLLRSALTEMNAEMLSMFSNKA